MRRDCEFDFPMARCAATLSIMPGPLKPSIFRRLHWRAILLGFVVDYGGSVAFGFISGLVIAALHVGRGGDPASVGSAIVKSQGYLTMGLVVGSLFVVLGGFIVGRIAREARLLNGTALGVVDLLIGLTYLGQLPVWYHVTSVCVTIPCALLGAWLAGVCFPNYDTPPPPLPPAD